jgi:hypothetical protein
VIPEEDRGPAWLRDYGVVDVDMHRMEEFAAQLRTEVTASYAPRLEYIDDDVTAPLPPVDARFEELHSFLTAHRESLAGTNEIVHYYRDASGGFATAAAEISASYGRSDAFAAARVGDVEAALGKTAVAEPTDPRKTDSGTPAAGATPEVY